MNLARIQEELRKQQLDGWLFFDHHGRDPLAYRILGLGTPNHVTRRWYYLIPAYGEPKALVHRIENKKLDSLPGEKSQYAGWQEHTAGVANLVSGLTRVAMQYSPFCEIPYIAMVDAGTLELVRKGGCEVVTSAELVQVFEAQLSQTGLDSHLEAGRLVDSVRAEAFQFIAAKITAREQVSEFRVAEFIRGRFNTLGLLTENGPTVGVNANSGNPHYSPVEHGSHSIKDGDFVLLDMWARLDSPDSIWYDITWTGYCGSTIPDHIQNVFYVVRDARDAAIECVRNGFESQQELRGFQVDDAARGYIKAQGFGPEFIHRTGHSIGHEVHGNGANMDNFEIHDERKLIPWSCFSIEPGIYLKDFGVRSEVNMFLTDSEALVTGAVQRELVQIT
jgi:Xaa-Pro dipeptidase